MGERGSLGFPLSGPYQVFLAEKRETEFTFSSYLALASSPLPYSRLSLLFSRGDGDLRRGQGVLVTGALFSYQE